MSSRTEKRIWFALAVPAVAFAVQELASALVAHAACAEHAAGVGRVILIVLGLVSLTFSIAAVAVGYREFRALSSGRAEADVVEDVREREQTMALAGLLVAIVLTVGVVWTTLPSIIVSTVCGAKR